MTLEDIANALIPPAPHVIAEIQAQAQWLAAFELELSTRSTG